MNLLVLYFPFILLWFSTVEPQAQKGSTEDEICISREEKQLYDMINAYRKQKKLPPVPLSASLTKVAKAHAWDLMENYDLEDRDKCNPHSWSGQGPWTECCYSNDHQNPKCMWDKPKEIAGYPGPGYEIVFWHSSKAEPERSLEGWKKSPGHNQVIINSDIWKKVTWNAVGIALRGNYAVAWFGEAEDEEGAPKVCDPIE